MNTQTAKIKRGAYTEKDVPKKGTVDISDIMLEKAQCVMSYLSLAGGRMDGWMQVRLDMHK